MTRNRKPKLCLISLAAYHYFNPDAEVQGGGAQRQLYLLSQELQSSFDVHFVVGDYGQPATEVRDGVTLHRSYTPMPDDDSVVGQAKRAAVLFDTVRRADADFYFFRGFPHKAAVLNVCFELLGVPWLYSLSSDKNVGRDLEGLSMPFSRLFDRAVDNAGAVVSQTAYQSEAVSTKLGVTSVVVPNGYPPAETVRSRDEREFVLWVGNVDEEVKRPHLFLDLAEQCPDTEFVMIGPESTDPEYHRYIIDRAEGLDNVDYTGAVDSSKIHTYFRRATALVNTSPKEGFPNTFLEAWRCATPVVGLDVDPGRFVDFPGPSGYADGDTAELVEIVRRLSTDESYWTELSTPAKEYFRANFTIDQVARQYENIIMDALDG
ncbi:glycosyltransferase family 4 protein [Halobaculum sp. MBLA0147]|uniref:glycosyltransferase family 4 protein n=1 Tax=Halobaculum sp. MBLA0147 TaxID=3079934 RepID=UPI0035242517